MAQFSSYRRFFIAFLIASLITGFEIVRPVHGEQGFFDDFSLLLTSSISQQEVDDNIKEDGIAESGHSPSSELSKRSYSHIATTRHDRALRRASRQYAPWSGLRQEYVLSARNNVAAVSFSARRDNIEFASFPPEMADISNIRMRE